MASADQQHWDQRYRSATGHENQAELPARFVAQTELLAGVTSAVEIACGVGQASVWLAQRGVHVTGYDISAVAIDQAQHLADHCGVGDLCRFKVADFDDGLPDTGPVALVLCNMFRDARLDQPIIDRLQSGGLLAIAALSEVGASPGRFRCVPGELTDAFASLEFIDHGEADGTAWLIARKP